MDTTWLEGFVSLQAARNLRRTQPASGSDRIDFALPRILACVLFPQGLHELRRTFPRQETLVPFARADAEAGRCGGCRAAPVHAYLPSVTPRGPHGRPGA